MADGRKPWMRAFWMIAALGVLLFVIGAAVSRAFWPKVIQPPPKVEYRDREILRRDTVTIIRPDIRIIYRTVEKLVRDTLYIPIDFNAVGVIAPSPINFKRGDIVLTYYSYSDSAFVQDRFEIPRSKFSYYFSAISGYNPIYKRPNFGFEAGFRYRRFTFYSRTVTPEDFSIGLRIRLKGKE